MCWSLTKQALSFPLAFLFAVALGCGPALGQSADQESSDETAAVDLHEQLDQVISLEVDNPPLRDFVMLIQEQVPLLNVVIDEAVKDIPVPQVKLQRVRAGAALESLAQLTGRRVAVDVSDNESFLVIRVDHETPRENEQTAVFNVRSWLTDGRPQEINPDLWKKRLEQLMEAIRTGLELLESTPDQLKFSLHEGTGLLFVRGQHREVELVQRIVNELQHSSPGGAFNPAGGGQIGTSGMGGAAGGPQSDPFGRGSSGGFGSSQVPNAGSLGGGGLAGPGGAP